MRALLPYIPILLAVGLTIFTVIDIALIDRSRVKGLPKLIWILICIVLVVIGPVLWFLLGRERLIDPSQAGGSFGPRPRRGPVAPDDDPEFLGKLNRESAQEQRIRDLEERLREIDDDDKSKE
jgi:hypothetical protein